MGTSGVQKNAVERLCLFGIRIFWWVTIFVHAHGSPYASVEHCVHNCAEHFERASCLVKVPFIVSKLQYLALAETRRDGAVVEHETATLKVEVFSFCSCFLVEPEK